MTSDKIVHALLLNNTSIESTEVELGQDNIAGTDSGDRFSAVAPVSHANDAINAAATAVYNSNVPADWVTYAYL